MSETRSEALLDWYERNRRDLPWRTTTNPWSILVSEVMLQQTQACRVIAHHRRFLDLYPTPGALAKAPLSEVLATWSGLGFNRRAVRLRDAAQHIADAGWPSDASGLQALPGVGPYTAAAVACFAFGHQLPTIDTNFRRVLSRWLGRPLDGPDLHSVAESELPAGRAADWNQALMDLGSLICRPREPSCHRCPVAASCTGPEVYVPPPSQGTFRGSRREARGAAIRALIVTGGEATEAELTAATGVPLSRLRDALQALEAEGMLTAEGGRYCLPGTA